MSNVTQERKMVSTAAQASIRYAKLRELNEKEIEKGNYTSLSAGDSVAGVYSGSAVDLYGKTNFTIETAKGAIVLPGSGNLGSRMSSVATGTYVEITYLGKSTIKSGPYKDKEAHNFEVLKEEI